MFGTNVPPSKRSVNEPVTDQSAQSMTAGYTETAIAPKAERWYGRRIAFLLDQTGIQMATASRSFGEARLVDIRKTYYPSRLEGQDERAAFASQSMEEYARRFGGRSPHVTVLVSGPETVYRIVSMPGLPEQTLRNAVAFEAKKQIPFPIQECQYDYRAVYAVGADGRAGVKIGLVAATQRVINDCIKPLTVAKIPVETVYHSQDVLGRLLRALPDYSDENLYTLVDVQRYRTEISYHRGCNLEFYHVCSLGSSFLANRSDLTVFEYFAEALAGEIQNSLDYYTGQYSGQFTNRIYIYGDLAYTDELIDLMHDHFGYEFRRFPADSLKFLSRSNQVPYDSLPVCLPVLAACLNQVSLANLLPAALAQEQKLKHINQFGTAALVILTAALSAGWLAAQSQTTTTQKQLDAALVQVESLKTTRLYDTYDLLRKDIAAGQTYVQTTNPGLSYFSLEMKELSRLTPSSIKLITCEMNPDTPDKNFTLHGIAVSSKIPPEIIVAEYIEALSSSPLFEQVKIANYSKKKSPIGFELVFTLTMKGAV